MFHFPLPSIVSITALGSKAEILMVDYKDGGTQLIPWNAMVSSASHWLSPASASVDSDWSTVMLLQELVWKKKITYWTMHIMHCTVYLLFNIASESVSGVQLSACYAFSISFCAKKIWQSEKKCIDKKKKIVQSWIPNSGKERSSHASFINSISCFVFCYILMHKDIVLECSESTVYSVHMSTLYAVQSTYDK